MLFVDFFSPNPKAALRGTEIALVPQQIMFTLQKGNKCMSPLFIMVSPPPQVVVKPVNMSNVQ